MHSKLKFPILVVDDDQTFLRLIKQSLIQHKLNIHTACSPQEALKKLNHNHYQYAIIDLNLDGESGLNLMDQLLQQQPECQVLILTGYASIATAVEAMRLGAHDYLCKPASVTQVLTSLYSIQENTQSDKLTNNKVAKASEFQTESFEAMSVKRLEWEHIQKVLAEHDGNITATAEALNMHRRTLQRKLQKRPVNR